MQALWRQDDVALVEPLRDRVVAPNVEPDAVDTNMLDVYILVVAKAGQIARDERFHDEEPVVSEVAGHVLEAADLALLGQEVEQRVEHYEDQPVGALDRLWGAETPSEIDKQATADPVMYRIGSAIRSYLRRSRIPPSPSWRRFLAAHAANIVVTDFFTIETVFLQRLHVFFFLHLASRRPLIRPVPPWIPSAT